jgi:hypothetical protein
MPGRRARVGMIRRMRSVLALFALLCTVSAASAQGTPSYSFDLRQFPGAPVRVTEFHSYTEPGGMFKFQHIVCLTYTVRASQPLTSVKFAVSSRDAAGNEAQRLTFAHDGNFKPGDTLIGHPLNDRKDCVEMNVLRSDAPVIAVRLIAATYADGTTWTAPANDLAPTPAMAATPSPLTSAPPAWTARSHAHYLAVAYGLDASRVAIFAPGQTVPSSVIALNGCCVWSAAFDASGNLFVQTSRDGTMIIPPGATAPTRQIAAAAGTALALSAAGDLATAGNAGDKNVHVFPGGAESGAYAIPANVHRGGVAFAPNGDLAVADTSSTKLNVYAHGSTTVARSVTVPAGTNAVGFDPSGHLAAANIPQRTIMLFQNAPEVEQTTIKGIALQAFVFDSHGRLLLGTAEGVQPFGAGNTEPENRLNGPPANSIAADGDVIATGDFAGGRVVLYQGDKRTVIGGLSGVRAVAFSP